MSLLSSSRFGGGGGQQQNSELESQIVNTVKQVDLVTRFGLAFKLLYWQDMDAVDKLGQWVFSCYSPAKDCASVPGMDDICPEEMRMEAYQVNSR